MAAAQGSLTSRKCLAASRSSAAPTRLQPLRVATVARPIVESPTSPQDSHLRIPVVQDQNQLVRLWCKTGQSGLPPPPLAGPALLLPEHASASGHPGQRQMRLSSMQAFRL
ncbi:chloroplast lycopene epsilon-cyclase [Haematococcus lacustris]|uniref:Chloroplast lycopene epsilon-cyclase n=1 Tax=Haematococcus lacustris TaxID=44745 RepID=A0A699ZII5_HAELA|nr:chloroplast lycopene epsilon-cyclase [Haematococcus lacustris]